jgi:excinuclease ABC subunit A
MDKPWSDLTKQQQDLIMFGTGDVAVEINWNGFVYDKPYEGVMGNLARLFKETTSDYRREEISHYQREIECLQCHGKRLNEKALSVKIGGCDIMDVCELSIVDVLQWFKDAQQLLSPKNREIASRILKEITDRLQFLINVGLGYLTLSRNSGTLSGGESQRIRLASQIGSGLTGVLYVLDEPSIGLHQRDNSKLLETLQKLKNQDNTVIVVEHDEDAIRMADYIVDMGIGAGVNGGNVIAAGSIDDIIASKESLTGQYLRGEKFIPVPKKRRAGNGENISVRGATHNNLKNVSVDLPLGKFICFTGVSGSGKSSLLVDTIYPAVMTELYGSKTFDAGKFKSISGLENIDKVIDINQSPIGRTPRSNPATYTGIFDFIRDWYANLPLSKQRGYQNGRFSFNVKGGRCEACQGEGVIKIEMHFLPDVYVECDECKGRRYNNETLDVKYRDKSIADVLDLTVAEALSFFENIAIIKNKLEFLNRVGLSYIKLGQFATTLSGGEAQRVKLAKELSKRSTGRTLYILDEPTTGLHFADVHKLLDVLHEFVNQGNTVVVIEHNLEVIKTADYVIDIGPEGGAGGGQIIAVGTPEDICKNEDSWTGKYLKPYLDKK